MNNFAGLTNSQTSVLRYRKLFKLNFVWSAIKEERGKTGQECFYCKRNTRPSLF